jgi:hypothetical protein
MDNQRCRNCGDPRIPSEEICDKCGGVDFVSQAAEPEEYVAAVEKEKQRLAFAAGKGLAASGDASKAAPEKKEDAKPKSEKKADEPKADEPKADKKKDKKKE